MCAKSLRLRPTLFDPKNYNLSGSSVHGDSPDKNTGVGCHALLQPTSYIPAAFVPEALEELSAPLPAPLILPWIPDSPLPIALLPAGCAPKRPLFTHCHFSCVSLTGLNKCAIAMSPRAGHGHVSSLALVNQKQG